LGEPRGTVPHYEIAEAQDKGEIIPERATKYEQQTMRDKYAKGVGGTKTSAYLKKGGDKISSRREDNHKGGGTTK